MPDGGTPDTLWWNTCCWEVGQWDPYCWDWMFAGGMGALMAEKGHLLKTWVEQFC